jgi:hypothetical protein
MEDASLLLRCALSGCTFFSLVTAWKLFLKRRVLLPRFPPRALAMLPFADVVWPLGRAEPAWMHTVFQLLFVVCIVLSAGALHSDAAPLCSLGQALCVACFMALDEGTWCPHMIHLPLASVCIFHGALLPLRLHAAFLYLHGGLQKMNHRFVRSDYGFRAFFNPLFSQPKFGGIGLMLGRRRKDSLRWWNVVSARVFFFRTTS